MTHIRINGHPVDWPKQVLPEAALRVYAEAPADTHDVWQFQESTGRRNLVTGVANLRDGHQFRSVPKKEK